MAFKGTILVDTNTLLAAHRSRCWRPIAGGYRVETVEECITETQTGAQRRAPADRIDEAELRRDLVAVHDVAPIALARVALMGGPYLDAGEKALWAHALGRDDAYLLCGPDRASMRFGVENGLKDRLVSLEVLLRDVGTTIPATLPRHFGEAWLRQVIGAIVAGGL